MPMTKQYIIKNKERIQYLYMLVSLNLGYTLCHLLCMYYSIMPPCKKKRGDVIFYPYTQPGSDGYRRRIGQYEPFFKEDGIACRICSIYNDKTIIELHEGSPAQRYRLYRKIFWIRFSQVLESSHYKSVFIQRGLFPFYPDQKYPHLEKLLYKLNQNVTLDFWDSVWVDNPKLTQKTSLFCRQITCVNEYVLNHFQYSKAKKILFPIGVDLRAYKIKKNYNLLSPMRLIYTGNPGNVDAFLYLMNPVFEELKKKIEFTLVLVTRHRRDTWGIRTEFHDFNEDTFYDLLIGADIGICAIDDSEISHGKMAMKVLDYMAASLPCIASPLGLSSFVVDNENIIIANKQNEWIERIIYLSANMNERERIGENGRKMVEIFHDIQSSFIVFKEILINNRNSCAE